MNIIRVEGPEGDKIDLPVPTRINRIARVIYKVLTVAMAVLGIVIVLRTTDPLAWYGAFWLIAPLPAFYFTERAIKRVKWSESKVVRGMLLGAEIIIPLFIMQALPASPTIMHAFNLNPSTNGLALTDMAFMLVIGLGSIPANYTWARNLLGLER